MTHHGNNEVCEVALCHLALCALDLSTRDHTSFTLCPLERPSRSSKIYFRKQTFHLQMKPGFDSIGQLIRPPLEEYKELRKSYLIGCVDVDAILDVVESLFQIT